MTSTNFQDILNKNADDIHPPPVLPEGSYHTVLIGLPEQGESSKKKTPQLKFLHKIIAPLDDVDPDQITEFEADGETPNAEVIVFMKHEQSEDGKRTYSKVRYTAPIG